MRNADNERILSDTGEQLEKETRGRWRGNLDSLDASVKVFARHKERTPYGQQSFCFRIGRRVTNEELLTHRWFIRAYDYGRDNSETQKISQHGEPYAEIHAREVVNFFKVEQWHNGQCADALLPYLKELWQSLMEDGMEPIPSLATLARRMSYQVAGQVQAGRSVASYEWGQITGQRVHSKRVKNAGTAALAHSILLIVTVTKVEAQAVLDVFLQDKPPQRRTIGNKTYYELGFHGGAKVFMVQSEMGTATPGGAIMTVRQAIQDLKPEAVIMCGIAFGLRQDQQKLGDILVSRQLLSYEPQKVDWQKGQLPRGDRVTASERLLNRFRSGDNDWSDAPTHFGLILSGEKLVNDPGFRDELLKTEPEAIGGEMEGAGLYVAARDSSVDWILVKAICDWGDGNKDDKAQRLAARNSAQFVLHVLQLGEWSNTAQNLSPVPGIDDIVQPDIPVEIHFDSFDFITSDTDYVSKFHLPCTLVNQSAKTEVVRRLEVEIMNPANKRRRFVWKLFCRYQPGQGRVMEANPYPIPVPPNSSVIKLIEFEATRSIPGSEWAAGRYEFKVVGRVNQRKLELIFYFEISEDIHKKLTQHYEDPTPIPVLIE